VREQRTMRVGNRAPNDHASDAVGNANVGLDSRNATRRQMRAL
jgi:hypothetical protein